MYTSQDTQSRGLGTHVLILMQMDIVSSKTLNNDSDTIRSRKDHELCSTLKTINICGRVGAFLSHRSLFQQCLTNTPICPQILIGFKVLYDSCNFLFFSTVTNRLTITHKDLTLFPMRV